MLTREPSIHVPGGDKLRLAWKLQRAPNREVAIATIDKREYYLLRRLGFFLCVFVRDSLFGDRLVIFLRL